MFQNIGFVDTIAIYVSTTIVGAEEEMRIIRRNIVRWEFEKSCLNLLLFIRYCCLTQVLVLRDISMRVRKRFPNLESVVEAGRISLNSETRQDNLHFIGFLLPHELKQLESLESLHPKYWVPIQWVFILCADLRRRNKMEPEGYVNMLMGVSN